MKEVMIDKVTLNIGVGEAGEKVNKAVSVLQKISGQKPVKTTSKKRIPTWGVRPGLAIGTKVTVRGKNAEELLKKLLGAVDNLLYKNSFDKSGNVSFGIRSYIDIQGMKYDPKAGVFGMDVCVTFKRKGYRVKHRKKTPSNIGKAHVVKPEDTLDYLKTKYGVKIK
jgi:large subunit ribosomal protein L5